MNASQGTYVFPLFWRPARPYFFLLMSIFPVPYYGKRQSDMGKAASRGTISISNFQFL